METNPLYRIIAGSITILWIFVGAIFIVSKIQSIDPVTSSVADPVGRLIIAFLGGAIGVIAKYIADFQFYVRNIDEEIYAKAESAVKAPSAWSFLLIQPLFYPIAGGVLATALILVAIGIEIHPYRILGLGIITGLFTERMVNALRQFLPNDQLEKERS